MTTFTPVSEDFVKDIIMSSNTKSCDLDPMPTEMLKQNIDFLIKPITHIINTSLKKGIVPVEFKKAILSPLIKKANLDQNSLRNYRPVSNLAFLSKILEKVVRSQLKDHLNENQLHELFQSAYKENHSTETAMLKILNDLLNSADKGEITILSLLDLSAAFDTIDHDIMLTRLSTSFGIEGVTLQWYKSYLTGRTFSITIADVSSSQYTLKFGVPQGSVLGPILYTMYTQSLGDVIKMHKLIYHMYADDTQQYKSTTLEHFDSSIMNVENCIEDVDAWMCCNKLKNNKDKLEAITCSTTHKLKLLDHTHISVGDSTIQFSDSVKVLGVHIDKNLSMDTQISYLCKITYLELKRIANIRQYIDIETSKTLVSSFILSRLDYCNSLLAGMPKDKLNRLQRVQNNAARLILKVPKSEHITPFLKELHWLPIHLRIKYKIALLCFKALNGLCPLYIENLLKPYVPGRILRSCGTNVLEEPLSRLKTYGDRSFSSYAPRVWNALPKHVRDAKSISSFRSQLKTHLFKMYFD